MNRRLWMTVLLLGCMLGNAHAAFDWPSEEEIADAADTPRKLIPLLREGSPEQIGQVVVNVLQAIAELDVDDEQKQQRVIAVVAIAMTMAGKGAPWLAGHVIKAAERIFPGFGGMVAAASVVVAGPYWQDVRDVSVAALAEATGDEKAAVELLLDPLGALDKGKGRFGLIAARYARLAAEDPWARNNRFVQLGVRPWAHIEPEGERPAASTPPQRAETYDDQ